MDRLAFMGTTTRGPAFTSPTTVSASSRKVVLMPATDGTAQLMEINRVAALLRRHGFSFSDRGTWVVVNDPVHTLRAGQAVLTETKSVVLRTLHQARQFIAERT